MEQEKCILLDCRDAALGYEGKPVWEHLNFQVRLSLIHISEPTRH